MNQKTYPLCVSCIPWDFWPGSASKPGHALLLRSHKHTHMYALTLKAPIKRSTCVLCLFPAHEPCRWPIRVHMGSFHEIYVNIKHQENPIKHICVGNTEPAWNFRNTFSVALVIASGCIVSSVCVSLSLNVHPVQYRIGSMCESMHDLSLGALQSLCVRTCLPVCALLRCIVCNGSLAINLSLRHSVINTYYLARGYTYWMGSVYKCVSAWECVCVSRPVINSDFGCLQAMLFCLFNPSVASSFIPWVCTCTISLATLPPAGQEGFEQPLLNEITFRIRPQASQHWHVKRHRHLIHLLCGPSEKLAWFPHSQKNECCTCVPLSIQKFFLFLTDFCATQLSKDGFKISKICYQLLMLTHIGVLQGIMFICCILNCCCPVNSVLKGVYNMYVSFFFLLFFLNVLR